jgi:beta-lactamase class A
LPHRRTLLLAAAAALSAPLAPASGRAAGSDAAHAGLAALESAGAVRLGVAAVNTATGARLGWRAAERFAFCSTFKVVSVSAILKRSETAPALLQQRVTYGGESLVPYSPVTEKHVGTGMTIAELCAAALQYSDNTAANLIIRALGGPAGVTRFARAIGDNTFRLDRMETALNTAIPHDPRDTSTPAAMMRDTRALAAGGLLGTAQRTMLVDWMKGCTTGGKRIRAGVPAGWQVADKTGTGDYGTTNDLGLVWPPGKPPIVLAIYLTQADKAAAPRDDIVARAAAIVTATLG